MNKIEVFTADEWAIATKETASKLRCTIDTSWDIGESNIVEDLKRADKILKEELNKPYRPSPIIIVGPKEYAYTMAMQRIEPFNKSLIVLETAGRRASESLNFFKDAMERAFAPSAADFASWNTVIFIKMSHSTGTKRKVLYARYPEFTKAQIRKIIKGR